MSDYVDKLKEAYQKVETALANDLRNFPQQKSQNKKSATIRIESAFEGYQKVVDVLEPLSVLQLSKPTDPVKLKNMLSQVKELLVTLKPLKDALSTAVVKATDTPISVPDDKGSMPIAPKVHIPLTYRALKIFKTELDSIGSRAVCDYQSFATKEKGDEIRTKGKKEEKKVDRGSGTERDLAVKEVKNMVNIKTGLLTIGIKLKAAVQKGAVAVQKVKSEPTAAIWNTTIGEGAAGGGAGRDLRQIISNFRDWKAHPKIKDIKEIKSIPDPGNLAVEAELFGNGAKRNLDAQASPQLVLERVKEFSGLLKQVLVTYGDVMNGKVASKLNV